MLRDDELRLDVGRCEGGSFLRLVHIPTGISRSRVPLAGAKRDQLIAPWASEIEGELIELGLNQDVLPSPSSPDRRSAP